MRLSAYLAMVRERPSTFARRIGVSPATLSGWLHVPGRGPSRRNLLRIEQATRGRVRARDFEPEAVPESAEASATAIGDDVLDY